MKSLLFKTDESLSPLLLRLFVSFVIFPHGAQKLFGWFGGYGFSGTMQFFTETVGLPWIVGFIVILIEVFGPIALLIGWAVRFWSFALGIVMLGVILTNFSDYFFMDWFGVQKTEGMEFFLLVIGIAASLIYSGAGRLSIDSLIYKHSIVGKKETPLNTAIN